MQEDEIKSINWKEKFWIPVCLILISGFVGIIVAYTWEHFKFKREVLFERNLDYIIDSRDQAIEIYTSVDRIRRSIRTDELNSINRNLSCNGSDFKELREELRIQARKINYLSSFTEGIFETDSIPLYVDDFKGQLQPYLKCLKEERFRCNCTKKYPNLMNPLNSVIRMHTKEINKRIK